MTLEPEKVGPVVEGQTHIDGVSLRLVSGSLNIPLGQTLPGKTSLSWPASPPTAS